jgi:hypothetical protein
VSSAKPTSQTAERERAIELIRFLAWLSDDPELRADHLAWAERLTDPAEPFDRSELEVLRHVCHDGPTRLQAAVLQDILQDEPLPRGG